MKRRFTLELSVGLFVLLGIACILYLSMRLGNLNLLNSHHYLLAAKFDNVSGLVKQARVEISGVQIGEVHAITYNPQDKMALVYLRIEDTIALDDDTVASIRTSGMIGAKYVKLTPGLSGVPLKAGDFIQETESALNLEDLIGKYMLEGKKP